MYLQWHCNDNIYIFWSTFINIILGKIINCKKACTKEYNGEMKLLLLQNLEAGLCVTLYAKQKHLGCKKGRGQEEPATKSSDINYGQELCEQIRDLKLWYQLRPRSL